MAIDFFQSPSLKRCSETWDARPKARLWPKGMPSCIVTRAVAYVQELPDGRKFEIRFHPGAPPESHVERIREITGSN